MYISACLFRPLFTLLFLLPQFVNIINAIWCPVLDLTVAFYSQVFMKSCPFFDVLTNLSFRKGFSACFLFLQQRPAFRSSVHSTNRCQALRGWFRTPVHHLLWPKQWQNQLPLHSITLNLCFSYVHFHKLKGQFGAAVSSWRAYVHLVHHLMF